MGQDFKALYPWAEEDLARIALKDRREAGYKDNELTFCAWESFRRLPFTRGVTVKYFRIGDYHDPAFVQFDPLQLHIAREVRHQAEEHDGFSRLVVVHEAAHIRLHNNGKNSFSPFGVHDESRSIKEWSVEWQANTWAGYFLLPDTIVEIFSSPEEIVEVCNVDISIAAERFAQFKDRQRRKFDSSLCSACGEFKTHDAVGRHICGNCASRDR
jgi:Zn-dependent peptidase ImmA (M78 family)